MNLDIAQGQWKQLKGKVREQWGRLTDDEIDVLGGNYQRLIGKLQEKYGKAREEVTNEVNQFLDKYRPARPETKPTSKSY